MLCIEGTGAFSHFSLKHKPEIPNQQFVFSSLTLENETENIVKILEGPVPGWKYFGMATPPAGSGGGSKGTNFGLPRFSESIFASQFPFAWMNLQDPDCPLNILVEAWSPFIPHNSKDSSLPTAILEYYFQNPTNLICTSRRIFNILYTVTFISVGLDEYKYILPVKFLLRILKISSLGIAKYLKMQKKFKIIQN